MPRSDPVSWYHKNREKELARMKVYSATESGRAARHRSVRKWRSQPENRIKINNAARRVRTKRPYMASIQSARARCRKSGIEFDLTTEWAAKRYTGFCEVSGLPFDVVFRGKCGPVAFSFSIDRIDPNGGYTQKNCRFVLFCVNTFKHTMADSQMVDVAKAIVQHRGVY